MYLVLGIIIGIFLSFIAIVAGMAMYLQNYMTINRLKGPIGKTVGRKAVIAPKDILKGREHEDVPIEELL